MDRNAFKHLAAWNQSMGEALDVLSKLAEHNELSNEDFTIKQAYFKEQFASVNISVLHVLEKAEQKILFSSFKERRAFEKKTRDPDDCYFDVLRREEERRDLGLPPLIGVLRGMRRATSQEILSEILDGREKDAGPDEVDPSDAEMSGPGGTRDGKE